MKVFAAILCLVSLGCATAPVPLAEHPVDWEALDDRWSLLIVTVDPGGAERVTRVWIAVVGDAAAVRTGDTRWWSNLLRDPRVRVRLSGTDHPFRVAFVTERDEKIRIDEAFLEKYGGWERLLSSGERGETHENYALLKRSEATRAAGNADSVFDPVERRWPGFRSVPRASSRLIRAEMTRDREWRTSMEPMLPEAARHPKEGRCARAVR